jgi:ACR3 family arsenite efflux pump ArsB
MEAGLGLLTRMQPLLILAAAITGIILGQIAFFSENMEGLIVPFLMVLLFLIFLKVEVKDIAHSFKNVRFSSTALLLNFVWTPIFALILGYAFLTGDLRIGFLMLLIAPCTDWFMVFTAMSKGNVSLSASILPLNLVIQLLFFPLFLFLYLGAGTSFDMGSLLFNIVYVLAIPFIVANIIKAIIKAMGKKKELDEKLGVHGDNMQLFILCLAVFAMFAPHGGMIVDDPMILVRMLIPLCLFFTLNFIISRAVGKALKFPFDDTTSLTFTVMARNSPLALAIAVAAFPESPLIALALIVGPLIELPILSLSSAVVLRMRGKKDKSIY